MALVDNRPFNEVLEQPAGRRARGEAVDLVCARLLSLARELGPDARLPGLRTLGEELQVSSKTMHDALNRLERQRILVRRERSGVFVAPLKPHRDVHMIVSPDVFLQSNVSPFWEQIIEHTSSYAESMDTRVTLAFARSMKARGKPLQQPQDAALLPEHLQAEIRSGNIHGVVSIGLPHPTACWIEAQGIPVVAFAGAARYVVATSYLSVLRLGAEALSKAGCKRIDLWLPPTGYWHYSGLPVESVLSKSLGAAGISLNKIVPLRTGLDEEVFHAPSIDHGWDYAYGCFQARRADWPDGILCVDDMITLGGLMAMTRMGVGLGEDVHFATYSNAKSSVLRGWHHKLWRVELDATLIVERLLNTLDKLMEKGPEAANGEYVPSLQYDDIEAEYDGAVLEKYQLIHPILVPPDKK